MEAGRLELQFEGVEDQTLPPSPRVPEVWLEEIHVIGEQQCRSDSEVGQTQLDEVLVFVAERTVPAEARPELLVQLRLQ